MDEPEGRRRLGMGAVGQLLGVPRLNVWWLPSKRAEGKPPHVAEGVR
ncbi:hypothetical protein [Micromonospora sp. NPDC005324]